MSDLVVTQEEWPYGLRCVDCDQRLDEGTVYSKRLIGLTYDGTPITEITCVICALPSVVVRSE